jgi:preprotein translocase subunit SecA
MRLFGSDRISKMMDRLGIKDGEVISHSMITKSIERAQKKVEENNFGIRKRLLEYDDVMNNQREVIYSRRRNALYGEKLSIDISNSITDVSESIVLNHHGSSEFEDFEMDCIRTLALECPVTSEEYYKMNEGEVSDKLAEGAYQLYRSKTTTIAQKAKPVIRDVFEKSGQTYTNIVVPMSDGTRVFQIVTNLKKAYETDAKEVVRSFEKTAVLVTIDDAWKEHLRELDDLKQAVQAAAYEQKDPLLIYKFESFELFKRMLDKVNREVVSTLMKCHIPINDSSQVKEAQAPRRMDLSKLELGRSDNTGGGGEDAEKKVQPVRVEKKVGRNDPCPCGSGKKYKNCHGQGQD